jgi:hypothetical protein
MLLDIDAYPIRQFAWLKEQKKLVAEASTLSIPVGRPPFGQLYDDACDVGIRIQGDTTDYRFLFNEEEVNAYDNELLSWKFVPLDRNCPIEEVIIFND